MDRRRFLQAGAGLAVFAAAGCERTSAPGYVASTVPPDERAATIAGMRPPKRQRPLIAILGENTGSETTDFILPYSVLTRSGVADVVAVGMREGPIKLNPALHIMPQMTAAAFDAAHPDGPDYVIVPAYENRKPEGPIAWMQEKSKGGSTIIGVCAGALTLAHAGLLEGRRATTHWFSTGEMQKISPKAIWVKDRRFLVDRGVVTTTGVSASLPMSLTLIEAIAGRAKAEAVSQELGGVPFDQSHDSSAFSLHGAFMGRVASNVVAFATHESVGLKLAAGVDELAVASTADAWSRTYKTECLSVAAANVRSKNGLVFVPDRKELGGLREVSLPTGPAGRAVDQALADIAKRYEKPTAAVVAQQLEYPWTAA
ncbi:MAG TPA: DJ-1/PfpI family protein [Hyphomonadaceae bacterium]|jgi:putative intracellular protease/amidase|nr:DJ-1/PfpI family protein [Hyphomonadaceae bacterium]